MARKPASPPKPHNPHDAYFKWLMGIPRNADCFIRERLPQDMAALIGPEPPKPVPGSFIDEDMREHLTDLLFSVRLIAGVDVWIYVLLEHKSAPDRLTRLQLWRYMARIWAFWELNRRRGGQPPMILPVVVHHGQGAWGHSTEFAQLFDPIPNPLVPFIPHFRHILVDLTSIPDEELSTEPRLRAELRVMKRILSRELPSAAKSLVVDVLVLDEVEWRTVLRYIAGVLGAAELLMVLEEVHEERNEEKMEDFFEYVQQEYRRRGLADGREEGRAKGREEGRREGKAEALTALLARRFGPLDDDVKERIARAGTRSLDRWLDRALDAPDLDSVLASKR